MHSKSVNRLLWRHVSNFAILSVMEGREGVNGKSRSGSSFWVGTVSIIVHLNCQSCLTCIFGADVSHLAHRYQGTYCGQYVAVKVLNPERMTEGLKLEFQQEVFIMR